MEQDVKDKPLGISMRMIRDWTPSARDTGPLDLALHLVTVDPRDDETPFAVKLADALEYIRLNTH